MGLNSTFPRCILFGDRRYQGLQMANLYVRQGTDKLKMYIGHTRLNSETGKLLAIEKSYVELLSGQGKCPLANPEINEDSWAATSWIQTLGRFIGECDRRIHTDDKRVIGLQRANDRYIMCDVKSYSVTTQRYIQQCRLYLKVQMLSDITTAGGNRVERSYYAGGKTRESTLRWPNQGKPNKRAWKEWCRHLDTYRCAEQGQSMQLKDGYKLGNWINSHQKWEWRGKNGTVENTSTGEQYSSSENRRRPRAEQCEKVSMENAVPAEGHQDGRLM